MNTRRSPDLSASLKLSGVSLVSLDIWSRRQTESLLGCTTIAARLFLWVTTGRWRCGVNMFRLLRLEFERITCSVGHTRAFRPCLYIKPIRTNSRTCKQHLTARLIRYAHFQHSASSCTDPSYCFPADLGHWDIVGFQIRIKYGLLILTAFTRSGKQRGINRSCSRQSQSPPQSLSRRQGQLEMRIS